MFVSPVSLCLIRVPLVFPEGIRIQCTCIQSPFGFSLRHKFTVYVMTHAYWFTSTSHSGVGHLACYIHSWALEKLHTHTHIHTHWCTVSGSWIAPEWELWLFPGRMLAFPQTRPKPDPELSDHGPHSSACVWHSSLKRAFVGQCVWLNGIRVIHVKQDVILYQRCEKWLDTFTSLSSCITGMECGLNLAQRATCRTCCAWEYSLPASCIKQCDVPLTAWENPAL